MRARNLLFLAAVATATVFLAAGESEIRQPAQPKTGPGSSDYPHQSVKQATYGEGNTQYWLYEPDEPKPANAPVIIFCHGWSAMNPAGYEAWLEHLARRGNIVIYPRYQEGLATPPDVFTSSAITAIKDALKVLNSEGHVKPDMTNWAAAGHSFGGVIAANLAAVSVENGLPAIKAALILEPGNGGFAKTLGDYSKIPKGMLLLCVAGEDDNLVRDRNAKGIFNDATQVAKQDKNFILLLTDKHGSPPQNANHFAPAAPKNHVDAHDWYGFWKWMDGLTDAAFFGKNRAYALGNTEQQRFMGNWSDGVPIKEPKITDEP